jgi:hypothetical protein
LGSPASAAGAVVVVAAAAALVSFLGRPRFFFSGSTSAGGDGGEAEAEGSSVATTAVGCVACVSCENCRRRVGLSLRSLAGGEAPGDACETKPTLRLAPSSASRGRHDAWCIREARRMMQCTTHCK